jgi:hypothetical protein
MPSFFEKIGIFLISAIIADMDNNAKRKNKAIAIAGTVLLLALLGAVLYGMGYRVTKNLSFGKVGTVQMTIPASGTSVFADTSQKVVTTSDDELVSFTFSPTTHTVIVSREGYFPWKKDIDVPKGGTVALEPLFVSKNATGEIITTKDPQYFDIRHSVETHSLPTKEKPLASKDGKKLLWIEDNTILVADADATNSAKIVIQPDTIVKNAAFYEDRDDVVLFSSSSAVYAIDADKTGGQNFVPVYAGESPDFISGGEGFIYVLDGSNLMEVII